MERTALDSRALLDLALADGYVATFTVPQGSYAFDPWTGSANVSLQLWTLQPGAGQVDVVASFTSDGGDCLAPGGFPETTATLTILVNASEGPAAPPPEPTPPTERRPIPKQLRRLRSQCW